MTSWEKSPFFQGQLGLVPESGFTSKQCYCFLLVICACSDSFLLHIHVGSTTVAMFRREGLQAQRIEISDIIFNEILNTASADMAGSASHHSLDRSHPGCDSVVLSLCVSLKRFPFWDDRGLQSIPTGGFFPWTPATSPIPQTVPYCGQISAASH